MENPFTDKDDNSLLYWQWEAMGWDLCYHTLMQWLEKHGQLEKPFNLFLDKEYLIIPLEDWLELSQSFQLRAVRSDIGKTRRLGAKKHKSLLNT
jgi:hypothetical protein